MDDNQRRMLDDLDARLLIDRNADARHAETLSLATIAAGMAVLTLLAVVGSRANKGLFNTFVEFSPVTMMFGRMICVGGIFLRDCMASSAKRAEDALTRLAQRHGDCASEMPDPGTATFVSGSRWRGNDAKFLPGLVVKLGCFIAVVALATILVRLLASATRLAQ